MQALLPGIRAAAPKDLNITPLFDQSVFVSGAINDVLREGAIAAGLTGLMILLFLGSWRSTLIVLISIPLSILTSLCVLAVLGDTLNIMTLGGLALAVGILVDDATVAIENTYRLMEEGCRSRTSVVQGAAGIAKPALISTLSICCAFVSVLFLNGAAKFLFTPQALAVVFAMLASYGLSRTLVPIMIDVLVQKGTRATRAEQGRRTRKRRPVRPHPCRVRARLRPVPRRLYRPAARLAAPALGHRRGRRLRPGTRRRAVPVRRARTTSRRSSPARSPCTSAPGPGCGSRRRSGCSSRSRTRSARHVPSTEPDPRQYRPALEQL